MKQTYQPRVDIDIDEHYTYTLKLGVAPVVKLEQSEGVVQVQIPYDGRLQDTTGQPLYERSHTDNNELLASNIDIGELHFTPNHQPQSHINNEVQTHNITLPVQIQDQDLAALLKSGQYVQWTTNYDPGIPAETLFAVEGHISDNAGTRKDHTDLLELVSGQDKAFTNYLYLHFNIWVPNLLSDTIQHLLERRADRILIKDISNIEQIAKSMAALINSGGGQIIIGIDERGHTTSSHQRANAYRNQVWEALIKASLQCTPPFPLQQPDDNIRDNGQTIFEVDIPKGLSDRNYAVKGEVYIRDGEKIVSRKRDTIRHLDQTKNVDTTLPLETIEQILNGTHSDPSIRVVTPSSLQDACCYISGLINTQEPYTFLILCDPPTLNEKNISRQSARIRAIENDLRYELRSCIPPLDALPIQVKTVGDTVVAVIALSSPPPVALYKDKGYEWKEGRLDQLSTRELLSLYTGWTNLHIDSFGQVRLELGKLNWHVQPPALTKQTIHTFNSHKRGTLGTYDPNSHALFWESANFKKELTNGGWNHSLVTPLQHALVELNDQRKIADREPLLRGEFHLCLDDVLASGMQVEARQFSHQNNVSTAKRTHIHIHFEVDTQQLFKRRVRRSFMNFQLLNAGLAPEHIHVLRRTFSDLGFRVNERSSQPLTFSGIQQKGFHDLTLDVLAEVKTINVNREMRYVTYSEHKQTQLQTLHLGVLLSGKGENVYREMSRVYRDMHRLLNERMQHLGTE